jgi:N-acetylneuraminate synthase
MSEQDEIDRAVALLDKDKLILMHCVSQYPVALENVNLRRIGALAERYGVPVGYSGHELDTLISAAAVGMGACAVERHITLDRTMWGSDHIVSIEPQEMSALVQKIRTIERALGTAALRCLAAEIPAKQKLRRVDTI